MDKQLSYPLLSLKNIKKSFGAFVASDIDELNIKQGTIHALIGPNGAGKTTLIRQIVGEYTPDNGTIVFDEQDISKTPEHQRVHLGVVRSFQITSIFPNFTVLENCVIAAQSRFGGGFNLFTDFHGDNQLMDSAMACLEQVGIDDLAHTTACHLAHGQLRGLEIAMALALQPKLLLLDEPMAGVGLSEGKKIMDLFHKIREHTTILLIEHDMDVVFNLADQVSVLVQGQVIATDTPEAIKNNVQVQQAYLGH